MASYLGLQDSLLPYHGLLLSLTLGTWLPRNISIWVSALKACASDHSTSDYQGSMTPQEGIWHPRGVWHSWRGWSWVWNVWGVCSLSTVHLPSFLPSCTHAFIQSPHMGWAPSRCWKQCFSRKDQENHRLVHSGPVSGLTHSEAEPESSLEHRTSDAPAASGGGVRQGERSRQLMLWKRWG